VFCNALFDVPNPDHRLRIAMTAQVRIVLDTAQATLMVPVAALGARNNDGSYPLRVLDAKGKAVLRDVKTGINNNVKVQILDGLAEGEKVIIGDATPAVAGN